MQALPFERAVIESYPARSDWDADAAGLVRTMLERWHLTSGEAFVGGEAAATMRVTTRDGSPAVLKVGFPHFEAVQEAVVLEAWCREGLAPAVLRQDAWTWSVLLDEVRPGTPLSAAQPHEAIVIGARLLARLHATVAPDGIPTLSETVLTYVEHARLARPNQDPALAGPNAGDLLDRGLDAAECLIEEPRDAALLHGDFNPGNVLAGQDGAWLAIDPKPMIGDPAFDLFPLCEQVGDPRRAPEHLAAAASIIHCEPRQAIRWAFVRSALNVSWYLTDGDREAARAAATEAAMWWELSEL